MNKYKITLLTSVGAALEFYDFVIYALLASYLSTLFFTNEDKLTALLQTFAVFAIGYLARPIGGLIFGRRADRYGRKKNFIITLMLMAFSTFAIGLLPTYHQIGISATILLIILRTTQGLAYGAELPGAITILSESIDAKKRGWHSGIMFLSVGMGTFSASLIIMLLTSLLNKEQMMSFGWRIPFLLGGVLAIVGAIMRRHLEETPLFTKQTPPSTPLKILFQEHLSQIFIGIGITLFGICFIVFYLYMPAYLHHMFNYPLSSIYRATTIGLIVSALLLPVFGYLSDRIGRSRQLIIGSIIVMCGGAYSLFYLVSLQTYAALICFTIIYQTIVAFLAACYPTMLAELFPTHVRHSGVALSYNIACALAGLTPVAANYIIKTTDNPLSVSLMLSAIAAVTLIASLANTDKTGHSLT